MNTWIKLILYIITIIVCSHLFPIESHSEISQVEEQQAEAPKEKSITVTITAYSSTPDQTDDTPFITAFGIRVHDGVVAANFLAFGTRVRFPELYQDKIFTVEDRMSNEYEHRVDIWFPTRHEALQFGVRKALMTILPSIIKLQ